MHVARWILVTVSTVSIGLAAVGVRVHRSEGGRLSPPSSGRLLPYDSVLAAPRRSVGVLTGEHLDQVVDVDVTGDTAFVLSPRAWRTVRGTHVAGPFGAAQPGAPGGLGRALRIVVADSGVYVLDGARRDVSRWTRAGVLVERWSIGPPSRPLVPQDLAVDRNGRPVVVVHEITTAGTTWLVLQLERDAAPVALLGSAVGASIFTQPRIAAAGDDILLVEPTTHALHWLRADRRRERIDPPVWLTPDSLRTRYRQRVARLGARLGSEFVLPDTLPSLRDLAVSSDGRVLIAVDPQDEGVFVEVFAADGSPLGSLDERRIPTPAFVTRRGVVRVVEEPTSIIFTLLPLAR